MTYLPAVLIGLTALGLTISAILIWQRSSREIEAVEAMMQELIDQAFLSAGGPETATIDMNPAPAPASPPPPKPPLLGELISTLDQGGPERIAEFLK